MVLPFCTGKRLEQFARNAVDCVDRFRWVWFFCFVFFLYIARCVYFIEAHFSLQCSRGNISSSATECVSCVLREFSIGVTYLNTYSPNGIQWKPTAALKTTEMSAFSLSLPLLNKTNVMWWDQLAPCAHKTCDRWFAKSIRFHWVIFGVHLSLAIHHSQRANS